MHPKIQHDILRGSILSAPTDLAGAEALHKAWARQEVEREGHAIFHTCLLIESAFATHSKIQRLAISAVRDFDDQNSYRTNIEVSILNARGGLIEDMDPQPHIPPRYPTLGSHIEPLHNRLSDALQHQHTDRAQAHWSFLETLGEAPLTRKSHLSQLARAVDSVLGENAYGNWHALREASAITTALPKPKASAGAGSAHTKPAQEAKSKGSKRGAKRI